MKKPKEEKEVNVFVGKKIPGAYLFLRNGVVRCLGPKHDIGWGPGSTDEQRKQFAKLLISVNTHELINYTLQENETLCNVIKDLPVFKDDEWTITSEELITWIKKHLRDDEKKDLKGLRCIECGAHDGLKYEP